MFFFFSCLVRFVSAQRKGTDEISSTAECPDSVGLPQTETGNGSHANSTWPLFANIY